MKKLDIAREVRTAGIAFVSEYGEWSNAGFRILVAARGNVSVAYRTPFTRVDFGPTSKPYGLDVWFDRQKVANIEWDDADHLEIVSLRRVGDWLHDLRAC